MSVILRERLIGLLEPLLERLGYELVELEYHPGRSGARLVLYIDKPGGGPDESPGHEAGPGEKDLRDSGIGLDDCERVSREASALLDVEDPIPTAYTLEVSSPGFDRVLRTPAHFVRFVGSRVHLELSAPRSGRKRYTGALLQADASGVVIEVDRERVDVPYEEIARARLAP